MRKPHLRLVIVNECNLSCIYCRAGGEGTVCEEVMNKEEILTALRLAAKAGYSYLKITGGEPLLREEIFHDLFYIISEIAEEKIFKKIGMVTNGVLLQKYANEILNSGLDSLTVSLDTSDDKEFKHITGRDCFKDVVDGIRTLKSMGMKININAVVSSINIESIPNLINLAKAIGVDLKLIDYVDFYDKSEDDVAVSRLKYISFDNIYKHLERECIKKEIELPYGGLGTPMTVYILNEKCKIYIKDATIGTNYNENCEKCKYYPCQDALISMRITADGQLKKCLIRDDNLVPFLDDIRCGRVKDAEDKFVNSWNELVATEYYSGKWSPR